jgi:hypothetical protein
MCFDGGGDSGASAARADQQAQQARSLAARGDVDKTFSQFDDNFYNQRAQAYRDYQTPQLNDQYADAQKQLVYALSRKGNLNSSVAGEQFGGLGKQYATNSDMVESGAQGYATQARQEVEANRSAVLDQLAATGDASMASSEAINRARAISQGPSVPPLGMLFTNLTGLAADHAVASNYGGVNPYSGFGGSSFGSRLFGGGSGSSGGSSYTVRS